MNGKFHAYLEVNEEEKSMKKSLSAVALVLAMLFAMPSISAAAAGNPFQDVTESHWAYHYVERAAEKGWITGVGGGRYAPEQSVTGAEFVTMVTKSLYFDEVRPGQAGEPWYQPYVDTAQSHGLLTNGLGEKNVLDNPVNRYRMAALLYNVAKEAGVVQYVDGGILTVDGVTVLNSSNASEYIGDWAAIPAEYQESVLASYALGLLSGIDEYGTFGGEFSMTRAQGAVVLCHINNLVRYGMGVSMYSAEVVELVNEERAKMGLGELRVDTNLQWAAQARALELIQSFSHTRPDGSSCFTVLEEYGVTGYVTCGENIAAGYLNPEMVMDGWMNSPGHRSNILSANFDTIAVGCVDYYGTPYWVQLFLG